MKIFTALFVISILVLITIYSINLKEKSWISFPSILLCKEKIRHEDGAITIITNVTNFSAKAKDLIIALERLKKSLQKRSQIQLADYIQKDLASLFKDMNLEVYEDLKNSTTKHVVCGEMFKGTLFGNPLYHKGWETKTCQSKPLKDFLSMVLMFGNLDKISIDDLDKLIFDIRKKYPELQVNVVVSSSDYEKFGAKNFTSMAKFHQYGVKSSEIKVLNDVINNTSKRYVFVAKDLEHFEVEEARLERLIWVLVETESKIVGGASRNTSGHWMNNCLQANFKNYSLTMISGYHHSMHSCLYCDVLTGPFVADVDFLKKNPFSDKLPTKLSFYDFFLRQSKLENSFMSCPDSMFFSSEIADRIDKEFWLPLAKENMIHAIKLPRGDRITFDCKDVQPKCTKKSSLAIPPCCLEDLANNVVLILELLYKRNIICELSDGTLLSGIKMETVFPWEVDADFTCFSDNFTAVASLKKTFKNNGLHLRVDQIPKIVNGVYKLGSILIFSKNWFIELWFMRHYLDNLQMRDDGQEPTKVLFHGHWLITGRNPGNVARNRYGNEIYRHSEHWRRLKGERSGFIIYKPGSFLPCSIPGHHSCLDQYQGDGNIQFGDVTLI